MKKFLTLLLVVIMAVACCVGLSACGKEEKTKIVDNLVLVEEQYGIATRKGEKAFMSKINEALIGIASTEYSSIAEKYGLSSEKLVTSDTTNPLAGATDDSWDKIKASGKIIIGYTLYAPIAYKNDKGTFVGFDTELAQAVVKYINQKEGTNISVEFVEIVWSAKETNLADGVIDLVWNGLTITDDRLNNMCVSIPYLKNNQVAVIREEDAAKYTSDLSTMKDAIMGSEKGSAGEEIIQSKNIGKERLTFKSQLDAFNQLKAGSVDVIVIDSVMANYYISLNK